MDGKDNYRSKLIRYAIYRRNSYGAQYNHKSNQKNKHGPVDSNHDGYRRTGQTITILQPLVYLPFVILY